MTAVEVDGALESGNIAVLETTARGVRLAIPADPGGARHWFHFRAGPAPAPVPFRLEGLAAATYPDGWPLARLWRRTAGAAWHVAPARFDGDALLFEHRPADGWTDYAPSVPFRDATLAAIDARVLGQSTEGRAVRTITRATGAGGARQAWIVAGQHAGEMPALWFAAGLVERLLDPGDAVARAVLAGWDVHVVAIANPDGHAHGWQRSDAQGRDLNREWSADAPAPEVAAIRGAMIAGGVDLCVDVHSDAVQPYVYIDEVDAFVGAPAAAVARREAFEAAFKAASPDFQTDRRYPWSHTPARADVLKMCGPWAADAFGALGLTLELPTSGDDAAPERGAWSPGRSETLAGAFLQALLDAT